MHASALAFVSAVALATPQAQLPTRSMGSAEGLIVGQVVDAVSGRPIAGAIVTLVGTLMPARAQRTIRITDAALQSGVLTGADRYFFNSRQIATSAIDAQGRYVVRNLPAGGYLIVARNDLDHLEWFDPETLQRLVPLAARITIADNEKLSYDITVPS